MIRSAHLLCAIILIVTCFACVQQPSPGPNPPPGPTGVACDLVAKVQTLPSTFDPASFMTPTGGQNIDPKSQYALDLTRAFAIATPAFLNALCGLDGIYLDQRSCSNPTECFADSWGFRQPMKGGKRYIAVSEGLWSAMNSPSYHQYETDLLHGLSGWNDPYYSAANADGFDMTLLAALAHEMGHVRWYDILDKNHNQVPDFSQLCDGGFFVSWSSVTAPPQWRNLQTPALRRLQAVSYLHRSGVQTFQFDEALSRGSIKDAGSDLDKIYAPTAPWASFFASLSPDEDFVETYKFAVLTHSNTPLKSLPIVIPGSLTQPYRENVPVAYWKAVNAMDTSKAVLALKTHCVAGLI
jgi:hypothetical protein